MEATNPITPVLKQFVPTKKSNDMLFMIGLGLIVTLIGVGSGYLMSGNSVLGSKSESVAPGAVNNKTEAGIVDENTFKDSAEGILREGGMDGEGTHHLERPGGVSQNAYLTSSVIDLSGFVDKKVTVWGQTISGKKAGWLMDVGKVKVIE